MEQQVPRGPKGLKCPMWRKSMSTVCHTCPWWAFVKLKHPQTGEEIARWECAMSWVPMLLLNVAREASSGAEATQSFRNAVVGQRERAIAAVTAAARQQQQMPPPPPQQLTAAE